MGEIGPSWSVRVRGSEHVWEGRLEAYWEVFLDPISDDYSPEEISAKELLSVWVTRVREEFPNGLIPISWFVECRSEGKFSALPFQFDHFLTTSEEHFLTEFTWPVSVSTGEPLNWLTLPVVNKLWHGRRGDKGGFIQQATGWKPSILQPYVYLPSLLEGSGIKG